MSSRVNSRQAGREAHEAVSSEGAGIAIDMASWLLVNTRQQEPDSTFPYTRWLQSLLDLDIPLVSSLIAQRLPHESPLVQQQMLAAAHQALEAQGNGAVHYRTYFLRLSALASNQSTLSSNLEVMPVARLAIYQAT